ncbi:hypothetical protein EYF80_015042 [Liparis tanakae]|uniref:Uncharacterized protein n=1 Tax=Liparis tanakae TaxID=230148 RepID=A0A4Z2IBK6_9TELE|nr:hypothetical protein EYF80_015042 [Liparis tanakae]
MALCCFQQMVELLGVKLLQGRQTGGVGHSSRRAGRAMMIISFRMSFVTKGSNRVSLGFQQRMAWMQVTKAP